MAYALVPDVAKQMFRKTLFGIIVAISTKTTTPQKYGKTAATW
jgi:hypothetical protein